MKTKLITLTFVSLCALALGACQAIPQKTLNPKFGNAVHANMAMQTLNPAAGQKEPEATTLYGQRGEKAIDDYIGQEAEAETDTGL